MTRAPWSMIATFAALPALLACTGGAIGPIRPVPWVAVGRCSTWRGWCWLWSGVGQSELLSRAVALACPCVWRCEFGGVEWPALTQSAARPAPPYPERTSHRGGCGIGSGAAPHVPPLHWVGRGVGAAAMVVAPVWLAHQCLGGGRPHAPNGLAWVSSAPHSDRRSTLRAPQRLAPPPSLKPMADTARARPRRQAPLRPPVDPPRPRPALSRSSTARCRLPAPPRPQPARRSIARLAPRSMRGRVHQPPPPPPPPHPPPDPHAARRSCLPPALRGALRSSSTPPPTPPLRPRTHPGTLAPPSRGRRQPRYRVNSGYDRCGDDDNRVRCDSRLEPPISVAANVE